MATIVEEKYATNIAAPKIITSEAQNREYISVLTELQRREHLSAEEKNYAKLLVLLIKEYEDKRYAHIGKATPLEVLKELVEANHLRPKDLIPVFGSKTAVSDALNGKRPFSKTHIVNLGRRFNISPAAFL